MANPKEKDSKVSEFTRPERPDTHTVKAVVVPLEVWDQISDAVKSAPYRDANAALKIMMHCQVHDIQVAEND